MSAITQRDPAYVAKVLPLLKLAMAAHTQLEFYLARAAQAREVASATLELVYERSGFVRPA